MPGDPFGHHKVVLRQEEDLLVAKVIVDTPDAPGSASHGTFSYSQAVVAGGLVFVSGQGPFDPATGSIVGSTIQEQTRQVLHNCDAILRAAGSSISRLPCPTTRFSMVPGACASGKRERRVLDQPEDLGQAPV